MAHIPSDDIKQLFQEDKEKSWSSLHRILQQHKGKAEGIEDSVVDTLMIISRRMEESHQPFPSSVEQLQRVLDNELAKVTA